MIAVLSILLDHVSVGYIWFTSHVGAVVGLVPINLQIGLEIIWFYVTT